MSDLELCKLRTASPASGTVELIRRCHWAHDMIEAQNDLIEAQAARIAELEEMALQYLLDAGQWCDLTDERDALRAENARMRGLFRRISWVLSPERSETEAAAYNFARAALEGVNPTPPQQGDDA